MLIIKLNRIMKTLVEDKIEVNADEAETWDISPPERQEEFPINAFPGIYKEHIEKVSEALDLPASLVGTLVLGTVAAASGKRFSIKTHMGALPPSLYIIGISPSGTGKSLAWEHTAQPLQRFNEKLSERWRMEIKGDKEASIKFLQKNESKDSSEAEFKEYEAKINLLKEEVKRPYDFVQQDCTVQHLECAMNNPLETVSMLSDDARSIIDNICGRNTNGNLDDSALVHFFSGTPYKIGRVGDEKRRLSLENPILSMLLLVQPDKFKKLLMTDGAIDGGFLPRCLIFNPEIWRKKTDVYAASIYNLSTKKTYEQSIQDLFQMRLIVNGEINVDLDKYPIQQCEFESLEVEALIYNYIDY